MPVDTDRSPHDVVRWTAFWQPKRNHADAEYEDAYAVSATDALPVHAAVADGATESAFARRWAGMLAEGIVEQRIGTASAFRVALPAWQARWSRTVAEQTRQRPWYVAAKAEQGAFAAVIGFTLHPGGTWQALSVGDCGLFHVRQGALQTIWPTDDPEAFDHHPALVPSRSAHALPPLDATRGEWAPGDAFLLASDAVAAWLLRTDPVAVLALDDETFPARIRAAREAGRLHNDDVTLLTVHVLGA